MSLKHFQPFMIRLFCSVVLFVSPSVAMAQVIIPRAPDIAATSYVLLDAQTVRFW